jgi:4-coumarate--CoA ligase
LKYVFKGILVPPAELEVELRKHKDILDAAVIGVNIAKRGTGIPRAYVVPVRPDQLKSDTEKNAFVDNIQNWMHGHLRGGCKLCFVFFEDTEIFLPRDYGD